MDFFKSEIVFVRILAPTALGIVLGYTFADTAIATPFLVLLVLLLLILLGLNLCYKNFNIYHYKPYISTFYNIAFLISGITLANSKIDYLHKDYFANHGFTTLKVVVLDEPEVGNTTRFKAKVIAGSKENHWYPALGKLMVTLQIKNNSINYGDELIIPATYAPIPPPLNPAEFDFKDFLAKKRIYHQVYLQDNEFIKTNNNSGNAILKFAYQLRQRQISTYRKLIKNDEAFAVASTLILGYRADLSDETLAAFSRTGTIHALSVSGAHVGIIFLVLTWILAFCNKNQKLKLIRFCIILILIWYYALVTGFSPSVLRAVVMLSVLMVAKHSGRYTNPYNTLAFTAFAMLVFQPLLLWDVGFQLSFIAVLGLIYLMPKITNWVYFRNKIAHKTWQTIAMSLSAQLATFPLSIYYFHQFPLYFLVANIFIVIPLIVLMYLGLGILMLHSFVSIDLARWLAPIFEQVIIHMNSILKAISNWPLAGIDGIWINSWQLVILSLALITLVYGLNNYHKKPLVFSVTLLLIFQGHICLKTYWLTKQQKAIFYSLKKNYGFAFINGGNCVLVTDLNAADKTFKYAVKPSLEQLQVHKIEFIDWKKDYNNHFINKTNQQLKFAKLHLLLVDKTFQYKTANTAADLVLLHDNVYLDSVFLTQIKFKQLAIDATVKDYRSKAYIAQAGALHKKATILKHAPALQFNYP